MSSHPRTAQLELELRDVRVRIPWEGTTSRALTKCAQSFILKAQAAKGRPQINCAFTYELELTD